MSEVELTSHLNLSWVVHRRGDLTEGGRVGEAGGWVGEVSMIESVEELETKLDFPDLSERKLFEQAQVDVFGTWAINQPWAATPEGPYRGSRKRVGIDENARGPRL